MSTSRLEPRTTTGRTFLSDPRYLGSYLEADARARLRAYILDIEDEANAPWTPTRTAMLGGEAGNVPPPPPPPDRG